MRLMIRYTLIFLLVLTLLMAYLGERDQVEIERMKAEGWKEKAEQLSEIPNYNEQAEKFVMAINGGDGDHKEMLTDEALKEYEQVLEASEEHHQDVYIDSSLIDTNILLVQTELSTENTYRSKVLFELDMSTVADNPDSGIVDQRIVTYVIEIDWKDFKVKEYELTWFNDTLGFDLGGESYE